MDRKLIPEATSRRVLMVGEHFREGAKGGMAAVIQYYDRYMEGLRYVASWRPGGAGLRAWYALRGYCSILLRLLGDRGIRIVHIHTAADASFWRNALYLRLSRALGRRTILHVHASRFKDFYEESSRKGAIVRRLSMADRLIVLSESWREWFRGIGVKGENILVLHNITDYPQLPKEPREEGRPLRLLFLGAIGQRKGVFDILRGLAAHKAELEGRMELSIGGNSHEEELLRAINDGGLGGMVSFEGWVSGEKKQRLLSWADVFILPSHNEGLPISILEAMSYGCPIISTAVGGIPEVVADGLNGTIVCPGDEEDITRAIRKYIDNPQLIYSESKESMKRVEEYLPEFVMRQLKGIYDSLLDTAEGRLTNINGGNCRPQTIRVVRLNPVEVKQAA